MKLSFVLTAVSLADDRKVPPRTPPQRLNTLHRFATEWIESQIGVELNRPNRADIMKESFDRLYERQVEAYENCGYFDPSVANGGPRPARKRRSDSDNVFDDAESLYSTRGVLEVRKDFINYMT